MAATTKIRIASIDNLDHLIGYEAPVSDLIGQRLYVVESHREGSGEQHFSLRLDQPRTNRGVARARGWLGTSNNVYAEAWGAYEVIGRSRTHLHLRPLAESPASFPANAAIQAYSDLMEEVYADLARETASRAAAYDAAYAR